MALIFIFNSATNNDDDDDYVELNVLGCRVDILGANCDQCVSMVQCCFTPHVTETETATSTFTQLPPVLPILRNFKWGPQ